MTVRSERVEDHDAVRRLVADAFDDDRVPNLLDALRSSDAWRDLSFVAEDRGDVVGHLCCTRGWLDAPTMLVEVLVLSPVSVRPDRQGRGIGSGLVVESLRRLASRPEPLVFLEGNPGFYDCVGLRPAG